MPPNLDVGKYVYDLLTRILHFEYDETTNAIKTISHTHNEIHDGNHYLYTDSVSLNNAGTQDYLLTAPNTAKRIHVLFVLDGSAITQFQLYEGSTRTGTALQYPGNSNRNSTNLPSLTIHKGTGAGADGTLLHQYKGGAASQQSRQGAGVRHDEEIILKQGTKYVLRVTSGTDSNLTNVQLAWYEEE